MFRFGLVYARLCFVTDPADGWFVRKHRLYHFLPGKLKGCRIGCIRNRVHDLTVGDLIKFRRYSCSALTPLAPTVTYEDAVNDDVFSRRQRTPAVCQATLARGREPSTTYPRFDPNTVAHFSSPHMHLTVVCNVNRPTPAADLLPGAVHRAEPRSFREVKRCKVELSAPWAAMVPWLPWLRHRIVSMLIVCLN